MASDDHSEDAVYYDLVRNPERFTGYMGASAVNVWQLIYDQNCFKYVLYVCVYVYQNKKGNIMKLFKFVAYFSCQVNISGIFLDIIHSYFYQSNLHFTSPKDWWTDLWMSLW